MRQAGDPGARRNRLPVAGRRAVPASLVRECSSGAGGAGKDRKTRGDSRDEREGGVGRQETTLCCHPARKHGRTPGREQTPEVADLLRAEAAGEALHRDLRARTSTHLFARERGGKGVPRSGEGTRPFVRSVRLSDAGTTGWRRHACSRAFALLSHSRRCAPAAP